MPQRNLGGRPRSVTDPKLPRGVRSVDGKFYWRGTDPETRLIEARLRAEGVSFRCGKTVAEAKAWVRQHVTGAKP